MDGFASTLLLADGSTRTFKWDYGGTFDMQYAAVIKRMSHYEYKGCFLGLTQNSYKALFIENKIAINLGREATAGLLNYFQT